MKLSNYEMEDGVYIVTKVNNEFENKYLRLRTTEKRVYPDEEVLKLPFASNSNSHKSEWDIREKSFLRFKNYLSKKNENLNILDLGCGNGWFAGQLSKEFDHNFFCVDVNLTELKQGKRVFNSKSLKFIYANIFVIDSPTPFFDLIIINSAIQYFSELHKLFAKLHQFLNDNGEIHIFDSPLYNENQVSAAKQRSQNYFSSIGFPEMTSNYFHHTYSELNGFNYRLLYTPHSIKNKFRKIFSGADSPFPWIIINK